MNLAVVGGAGFIGRHVVRRLVGAGHRVWTVDQRAAARALPGEQLITSQLEEPGGCREWAGRCGPLDGFVWLAASIRHVAGVDAAVARDLRVMVEGPLELLRALQPAPSVCVYASSIQVYGAPRYLPVDEDHPTDPFDSYGVAKLCAEHFLRIACDSKGVALTALRLGFVYGPGQHPDNVIPRFLDSARRGEAPTVYGDGRDLRDDVYVGDVARAFQLAVERRSPGVYNVASGRPHTILQVAETICRMAGLSSAPRHAPGVCHWIDRSFAVDRARAGLGFQAATSFEDGLREMWATPEGA